MNQRNYWAGEIALICSHCKKYRAFKSVEDLKKHIKEEHPTVITHCAVEDAGGEQSPPQPPFLVCEN